MPNLSPGNARIVKELLDKLAKDANLPKTEDTPRQPNRNLKVRSKD